MKTILLLIIKNLGGAFLTKKMVIWALKLLSGYTDNKIDDNVVLLAEAAVNNDIEGMKVALKGLSDKIKDKIKDRIG